MAQAAARAQRPHRLWIRKGAPRGAPQGVSDSAIRHASRSGGANSVRHTNNPGPDRIPRCGDRRRMPAHSVGSRHKGRGGNPRHTLVPRQPAQSPSLRRLPQALPVSASSCSYSYLPTHSEVRRYALNDARRDFRRDEFASKRAAIIARRPVDRIGLRIVAWEVADAAAHMHRPAFSGPAGRGRPIGWPVGAAADQHRSREDRGNAAWRNFISVSSSTRGRSTG